MLLHTQKDSLNISIDLNRSNNHFLIFKYERVRFENQLNLFRNIRINRKLTWEVTVVIEKLERFRTSRKYELIIISLLRQKYNYNS